MTNNFFLVSKHNNMLSKYIIFKFHLQRYTDGREERMTAEKCAKTIEAFFPYEFKEDALDIVGITTKGGRSQLDKHGNRLEKHSRNIACLLVEANKTKTITTDYTDHDEEHNPYLHVLFDFNPEHCFMAVERKDSVMKVDKVVELLTSTFNTKLIDNGWKFKCVQPNIPMDFWEVITFVMKRFDDKLKKVSLVFDRDKSRYVKEDKMEKNKRLEYVDNFINHFRKGAFDIDINEDNRLEEYKQDILYFATLCSDNGYQLEAVFQKFGTLCRTDYFPAMMPLGHDALDEFICGQTETSLFGCQLEDWFKNIHNLFDKQEEANEDERRREGLDKI